MTQPRWTVSDIGELRIAHAEPDTWTVYPRRYFTLAEWEYDALVAAVRDADTLRRIRERFAQVPWQVADQTLHDLLAPSVPDTGAEP